jgi:NADH:ubiquinone oxidoreductase subunit 5 (subunit L)/multisubunit Na+/H+ antiporter MnhA subunit
MATPLVILAVPSLLIGFLVGFPPDEGRFHKFLLPAFESGSSHSTEEPEHTEEASLYVLQETSPEAEGDDHSEGESATDDHSEDAAAGAADHSEEGGHHGGLHYVPNSTKWAFGIISTIIALSGIGLAYLMYIRGAISPVAMGQRFSSLYSFLYDRWRVDEFYDRTIVQPLKRLAMVFWRVIDVGIIDATVNGLAGVVNGTSARLRTVQTGLVANYALAIALGMVLIIGVYFAAFSDLLR